MPSLPDELTGLLRECSSLPYRAAPRWRWNHENCSRDKLPFRSLARCTDRSDPLETRGFVEAGMVEAAELCPYLQVDPAAYDDELGLVA